MNKVEQYFLLNKDSPSGVGIPNRDTNRPEPLISDKELRWWADGGSLIAIELEQYRAIEKGK